MTVEYADMDGGSDGVIIVVGLYSQVYAFTFNIYI